MNTEYPRSPSNRTAAFRLNNCSDGLLKNCVAYGYDDFAHISNCKNMRAIDCTHIPATNSSPAEDDLSEVRREPSENTNRGRSSTTFSFPPQKKELQQGLPKIIALAISRLSVNPAFAEPCFPQYSDSTQS